MNGPSKVCALVTTKNKVYTDPIGIKNGLWPLRCPQRKFGISFFLSFSDSANVQAQTEQTKILTQMGAIIHVSAINIMMMRGLNIILLMSRGVIAAEECTFAPVSALFKRPTQPYVGLGNNDPGNILFSLV
jgi:hypothetical protein